MRWCYMVLGSNSTFAVCGQYLIFCGLEQAKPWTTAVPEMSWSVAKKWIFKTWKKSVIFRRSKRKEERRRSGAELNSCRPHPDFLPGGDAKIFPGPSSSCWQLRHWLPSWSTPWLASTQNSMRMKISSTGRPMMVKFHQIFGAMPLPSTWHVWLEVWLVWSWPSFGSWLRRPVPAPWSTSPSMPFLSSASWVALPWCVRAKLEWW